MEVVLIIIGALFFVFLLKISGQSRQARLLEALPGPPGYPIVGNSFDFLGPREKRLPLIRERDAKYGPIYKTWLGSKAFVHITTPELFEVMLSSTKLINKGAIYKFVQPWLGTGLLTSTGAKWFRQRKMITPTFHFKILDSFVPVFHENSMILLDKLAKKAETQEGFDIYPYITLCALDIICDTAMGTKINAQVQESSAYVTSLYKILGLTMQRLSRIWLHSDFIFPNSPTGKDFYRNLKVLHDFTTKVIRERQMKRDKNEETDEASQEFGGKTRKAFLDLLLDASEEGPRKLTEEEIREEVDTFMFEGHDTTTAGICWALLLLANHTEVQQKVVEELNAIFEDDPGRAPTMRDLGEMKYLERVIKETLRYFPVVPFISRQLEEDVKLGPYLIPYGTTVSLHIFELHRNPKSFPNPDKFDPDRFLPEVAQNRHPYAYVPFSAGPRNCIGQKFAILEEKVVLSNILRKFKIEAVEKLEDLTLINELILRPKSGINVKLSLRRKSEKK